MTASTNLATQSISQLARAIKAGELSPVTLTESMLARIAALNPTLKAFNTVSAEQALTQARAAELEINSGNYRGPPARYTRRPEGSAANKRHSHYCVFKDTPGLDSRQQRHGRGQAGGGGRHLHWAN